MPPLTKLRVEYYEYGPRVVQMFLLCGLRHSPIGLGDIRIPLTATHLMQHDRITSSRRFGLSGPFWVRPG